jgi:hypothetical protein
MVKQAAIHKPSANAAITQALHDKPWRDIVCP